MTILNTLAFEPTMTPEFNGTIAPAELRGQVFLTDGDITKGQEIVNMISDSADTFLVSKPVFDHLSGLGFSNVAMFDPARTQYEDDRAVAQGGLLFSK